MRIPISQYNNLLAVYLRPQRLRVAGLGLLVFSSLVFQLGNPQIMRRFIDAALAGVPAERLNVLALLFIGLALGQQILSVAATYVGESVGWTATNQLRYDLARHCLRLDMAFHSDHTPGEMIERIDGDVNVLANFFAQFLLQVAGNGFLFIGILVLLIRESAAGGLILSLYFILLLFLIIRLRHLSLPHWHAARAASAAYYGFLEERLAGRETIRAYNAAAYVMRRFFDHLHTLWSTLYKAKLITSITDNSSAFMVAGGTGLAFAVGAVLYLSGSATIGSVYLIAYYVGMLFAPIRRILMEFEQLQAASASIVRVQELLQTQSKVHDVGEPTDANGRGPTLARSAEPAPTHPPALAFAGVSFTYRQADCADTLVLRDISFRLAPGQVLGLLGRTGSGKTTITRLLFRLYDPHQGSIHLDGRDIRTLPLPALRRHIGLVTQDVRLFHASVRHNLTFFDDTIGDETLLDIIHQLGLAAWYSRLPDGLNTMVAPGGGNLSAGEAQLLAFARVFLQNPGLVVLDEASARLDVATEQLIERAVDRLLQGRTAVIIAHRLSTIMRADTILILDNGRIRETGRRVELLSNPHSHFGRLLQTDALLSGQGGVS